MTSLSPTWSTSLDPYFEHLCLKVFTKSNSAFWGFAGEALHGSPLMLTIACECAPHQRYDDDAITIVPGSHRRREYDTAGATTLHPPKGSVVLMEQRATHRGRGILSGLLRPPTSKM